MYLISTEKFSNSCLDLLKYTIKFLCNIKFFLNYDLFFLRNWMQ